MTKKDLYLVGTKLIGLYFAAFGIITLSVVLFLLIKNGIAVLGMLVNPAVCLGVSFLLIKKTSWCLNKSGITTEGNSEQKLGQVSSESAPSAPPDEPSS